MKGSWFWNLNAFEMNQSDCLQVVWKFRQAHDKTRISSNKNEWFWINTTWTKWKSWDSIGYWIVLLDIVFLVFAVLELLHSRLWIHDILSTIFNHLVSKSFQTEISISFWRFRRYHLTKSPWFQLYCGYKQSILF